MECFETTRETLKQYLNVVIIIKNKLREIAYGMWM